VYVEAIDGTVAAVVTRDATQLPNALVVPATAAEAPFAGIGSTSPATVGGGGVRLGGLDVRAVRWRAAIAPFPLPDPGPVTEAVSRLARLLDAGPTRLPPDVRRGAALVAARLRKGRSTAAVAAAVRIIGLGPGLTPTGDDVLAGCVIALHRLGQPRLAMAFGTQVAETARTRTTSLSAALLRHAAAGEALPQSVALADALAGVGDVDASASALLRVGHTSGHDLARGLLLAARVAAHRAKGWDSRLVERKESA
jgi:hypothetical protein